MYRIETVRRGVHWVYDSDSFLGQFDGDRTVIDHLCELHNDWERLNNARRMKKGSPSLPSSPEQVVLDGTPAKEAESVIENYGEYPVLTRVMNSDQILDILRAEEWKGTDEELLDIWDDEGEKILEPNLDPMIEAQLKGEL